MKQLNKNLNDAKKKKNDEYFTQYKDVHNELSLYEKNFKDKIICCPCDTHESSFIKWLETNKKRLQIKAILKNHYDFRSPESIALMNAADIIITNPPFSLFRNFYNILKMLKKDYLVVANFLSLTCKNIFNDFKNGEVWLGNQRRSMYFITSEGIKKVNACWLTNMDYIQKDIRQLEYIPYVENYDVYNGMIVINKLKDIPGDYPGVMLVPFSFLEYYNKNEFKIFEQMVPVVNGKKKFRRIAVQKLI